MSENEPKLIGINNECGGDDDEWAGDLITTPNRLISDEFFVLKAEDDVIGDDQQNIVENSTLVGVAAGGPVSLLPPASTNSWPHPPYGLENDPLFDSPIMLPNSQGSPTTGSFPFPPVNHETFGMNSVFDDSSCDSNSFTYQPNGGSLLWPSISDLQNQPALLSEFPGALPKESVPKVSAKDLHSFEKKEVLKSTSHNKANGKDNPTSQPTMQSRDIAMRNSEDGYNWRKYGQKQVKGSEYPRSYYKCTHPNCQVKKKVERSHDGHITEIIYKGAHNHQGQRDVTGSTEANGSYLKFEDGELWENIQQGGTNNGEICRTPHGIELPSSTTLITDNSHSLVQGKSMGVFRNPQFLSSNNKNDVNEDETHIGKASPGDEADEDKSDLRRRKKGNFFMETSLVTRAMREPRVVVQIESAVDILDDGYRWRKYGQKVVKGNPNPRSYYKCTTSGCPVRKHIERASDDLKSVLTTYEGKHNHEIPVARNSSHANMDAGPTSNTPNNNNIPLSKIPNVPKPEPQNQDLPINFNRKLTNSYMPSSFVGNFDTEPAKFESSPIYQAKLYPFQTLLPFNSVLPDFPISLPMNLPPPANMVHNSFGCKNGKRPHEAQSFLGQQLRDNNGRYLRPKLEQDDSFFETFLRAPNHVTDASSRYCSVIPNYQS
uniref:probable WRKY transcription factor 20 n=1 Tax=Erigeron canadensis TaxID=72917 RepID=UPI001CB901F2|nr:probable WRKY transcription factor 20 [Erigeron canadensis]